MKTKMRNDKLDDRINPPTDRKKPGGTTRCRANHTVARKTAQCKYKISKLNVKRSLRHNKTRRCIFKKNNKDIM